MDIRSKVADGGERGLLGLAFDPELRDELAGCSSTTRATAATSSCRGSRRTRRARTSTRARPGRSCSSSTARRPTTTAAPSPSARTATCTSASATAAARGDPGNNAQEKTTTLLGKILRINVNGTGAGRFDRYSVPSSNPFAGPTPGLGEIWAYGLRNPWRISFDRGTGQLFIADVGQDRYEEINRENAGVTGGRNYGWNAMEGKHCFTSSKCPMAGDTLPDRRVLAQRRQLLDHRRLRLPRADPDGARRAVRLRRLVQRQDLDDPVQRRAGEHAETLRADTGHNITSFGESENGELYVVTSAGDVYQVLAS